LSRRNKLIRTKAGFRIIKFESCLRKASEGGEFSTQNYFITAEIVEKISLREDGIA